MADTNTAPAIKLSKTQARTLRQLQHINDRGTAMGIAKGTLNALIKKGAIRATVIEIDSFNVKAGDFEILVAVPAA